MDINKNDEDKLNELSMNILVHAGNARSFMVQGLQIIETENNYDEAEKLIAQAHKEIVVAHGLQTETLQKEAMGKSIRYSVLFCHAQDTLMTAQSEVLIAKHLIKLCESKSIKRKSDVHE
ncbi:PTS lactose/cellobiose transporter subunit IIA [Liquorilactobacillus hordei]|uniref:PTS lactose/cellobiose transporter subunit IIA n=1 Tax=Liquorilactobacillus hordei TaxID=468911 RepID=UPI0039EC947A